MPPRTKLYTRLTALLGVLVALSGLAGYWFSRDVQRTVLSEAQQKLVNPRGEFQASFVLAGRDYTYDEWAGPMVERDGELVRSYVTEARLGDRTDTIIYVNIVGNKVYMISIPRDIYLPQYRQKVEKLEQAKINAVYTSGRLIYGGDNRADYLRSAVSEVLGVPIDYYMVVNIDIFEELVDALGGVEVDVPTRMYHRDQAAGLLIDLEPGLQRLNGEQASGFVRFRDTLRGDIDRIDNVQTLASALLKRLQELHVRAVSRIPALANTYFEQVETNLSPMLVSQIVPRLGGQLKLQSATLPTHEVVIEEGRGRTLERKSVLAYEPNEVERFLAGMFGGAARPVAETPDLTVMLSNRSGLPGLAAQVKEQLVQAGLPAAQIRVRHGGSDPVTRVVTTHAGLSAAPFYADLFGVGWQQVDRLALEEPVEIILGKDAKDFYITKYPRGGQPEL